jgi:hypothetical protein
MRLHGICETTEARIMLNSFKYKFTPDKVATVSVRGESTIMLNPFYTSGSMPSAHFVGREQTVENVFKHIKNRSNSAFHGISGIGKSSLLRFICDPVAWQKYGLGQNISDFYPVFIDCLSIAPFTPQNFFRQILESLRHQFEEPTPLSALIDSLLVQDEIDRSDLGTILGHIEQDKKNLLLLLDDFSCALTSHESNSDTQILTFLSDLRALAINCSHIICVTTHRSIVELSPVIAQNSPSPWYNQYSMYPIDPFSEGEIEEHFFQAGSRLKMPIVSEALKDTVLAITHGHPALLQHAGNLLHEFLSANADPLSPKNFAERFFVRTEHLFQNIWRCSTQNERVLLMLIALNNQEGRLNDRKFNLRNLDSILRQYSTELIHLKKSIVVETSDSWGNPQYKFASAMMEWWILQEIERNNGASLEKYEMTLLNLISQEQMANIKGVFSRVWETKENIASFIESVVKISKV